MPHWISAAATLMVIALLLGIITGSLWLPLLVALVIGLALS